MKGFTFWCSPDRLKVQFVSARQLGRYPGNMKAYRVGGEYRSAEKTIRLPRYETPAGLCGLFLHEFGHYVWERMEMTPGESQETVCDMLTWVAAILYDPRNDDLRTFLGFEMPEP